MVKLLLDAGTSWCKLLELFEKEDSKENIPENAPQKTLIKFKVKNCSKKFSDRERKIFNGHLYLFPTNILGSLNLKFDMGTGHMSKNFIKSPELYENEVVALAYGAKKILNNPNDAVIVDIGSRDIKWVRFENGKYKDLDWNATCGSATGATAEMLCKFYEVNPSKLIPQNDKIPVTCGVFAMEKIMDAIANKTTPEIAIAQYLHGIAYNTWNFAKRPKKIFLSGGFCLNQCFIDSLGLYCEVIPLGRFVILEGLY